MLEGLRNKLKVFRFILCGRSISLSRVHVVETVAIFIFVRMYNKQAGSGTPRGILQVSCPARSSGDRAFMFRTQEPEVALVVTALVALVKQRLGPWSPDQRKKTSTKSTLLPNRRQGGYRDQQNLGFRVDEAIVAHTC